MGGLAVSEVLYICEQHNIDLVIVAADVEDPDVIEVQLRRTALILKPGATALDVIWELSQLLLPGSQLSIQ